MAPFAVRCLGCEPIIMALGTLGMLRQITIAAAEGGFDIWMAALAWDTALQMTAMVEMYPGLGTLE